MRQGGDDTKWRVYTPGTYRITVNLFHETIETELLSDTQQTKTDDINDNTGIEAIDHSSPSMDHTAIYDLSGRRIASGQRSIANGIYIQNHKKILIRR